MSKRLSFPKWTASDGEKRPSADEELKTLIAGREAWAAARIVGWDKRELQEEDRDFSSWADTIQEKGKGAENGHFRLRLGVCYEYARESRKLRGLLLLADPKRSRETWEFGPMRFAGVNEDRVRKSLAEMFDALAALAIPLAANMSFAEVWIGQRELVEQVIRDGILWRSLRVNHGVTSLGKLKRGAPVELVWKEEAGKATTQYEFQKSRKGSLQPVPCRVIKDGKEIIALRVDWKNYRDEQLKEDFGRLIRWMRKTKEGRGKMPPEPKPAKEGKKAEVLHGALKNLRAARVLHHAQTPEEAWEKLGLNQTTGNKEASNYYRYAKRARIAFKKRFPFEGEPAHHRTPKGKRAKV